jgi:hypothetical protein
MYLNFAPLHFKPCTLRPWTIRLRIYVPEIYVPELKTNESEVSGIAIQTVLKRQSHEISDLWFFHKSITPRPLINSLKYFRILFRIRGTSRL